MKVHHPSLESYTGYLLAARHLRLLPAIFKFELQNELPAKSFAQSLLFCTLATSLDEEASLVDWTGFIRTIKMPVLVFCEFRSVSKNRKMSFKILNKHWSVHNGRHIHLAFCFLLLKSSEKS